MPQSFVVTGLTEIQIEEKGKPSTCVVFLQEKNILAVIPVESLQAIIAVKHLA